MQFNQCTVAVTLLYSFLLGSTALATEVVRVTGIPDENPTELQRKNRPLVSYLEAELGAQVEYIPVTDYGAAVQALASGKVDFAWLGGFTHVQSRRLAGAGRSHAAERVLPRSRGRLLGPGWRMVGAGVPARAGARGGCC